MVQVDQGDGDLAGLGNSAHLVKEIKMSIKSALVMVGSLVALSVMAVVITMSMALKSVPSCPTEDGFDGTGKACVWTDPDTGKRYYNDGK